MHRSTLSRGALWVGVSVGMWAGAQVANAQSTLFEAQGSTPFGYFGTSVCSLGDLDGDGVAEFAVGALDDSTAGSLAGSVRIYSGRTGTLLHTLLGHPGDTFGIVADAGDLDGDGLDDLLVGAPQSTGLNGGPGKAFAYSSSNWNQLFAFAPPVGQGGKSYGLVVAGGTDYDGDGIPDLVITDTNWNGDKFVGYVGQVYIYSGASGALLHSLLPPVDPVTGQLPHSGFGRGLATIPDFDGDAIPDLLVGQGNSTKAYVVSVGSGLVLRTYDGGSTFYGGAVLDPGDVDGDGIDDHLVGGVTRVDLYSGASGALLRSHALPAQSSVDFPALARLGDLDLDGRPDYAIGFSIDDTAAVDAGSVTWISGASGTTLLAEFGNSTNDHFGASLALVGDIDGDAVADLLIGAPDDNSGGGSISGSAFVVSTAAPKTSAYCVAKTNSKSCIPFVDSSGAPSLSGALPFVIRAHGVLNQKNGILFFGSNAANIPFQGGTLCVQPPIQRTPPASSGGDSNTNNCSGTYAVDFGALIHAGTNPNLQLGASVYCQFWSRDPSASFGSGLTNALSFTILP